MVPAKRFRDWARFRKLQVEPDCDHLISYAARDDAEAAAGVAARVWKCEKHQCWHQITTTAQCVNKKTGNPKVAFATYDEAWQVVLDMNESWAAPYPCKEHGWHIGRRSG
jgi:hypothetical protein